MKFIRDLIEQKSSEIEPVSQAEDANDSHHDAFSPLQDHLSETEVGPDEPFEASESFRVEEPDQDYGLGELDGETLIDEETHADDEGDGLWDVSDSEELNDDAFDGGFSEEEPQGVAFEEPEEVTEDVSGYAPDEEASSEDVMEEKPAIEDTPVGIASEDADTEQVEQMIDDLAVDDASVEEAATEDTPFSEAPMSVVDILRAARPALEAAAEEAVEAPVEVQNAAPETEEAPQPSEPQAEAAPSPVEVPMPATGRGKGRAGRAKTRLLGFNTGTGSETDPISKAANTPGSEGYTQFPVGWLVVTDGPGRGAAFTLYSGVAQIGRGEGQAVRLDFGDNSISRENHAAIAYDAEQNGFFIGHGGKANLVRCNNMPVLATQTLTAGDSIRIGETTLRFIPLCGPEFDWSEEQQGSASHAANG